MRKSKSGFTIVELGVVITVIAILVVITVGAYRGYQEKSRNNDRVVGAQQAISLLKTYINFNNGFPASGATGTNYGICLSQDNVCTDFMGAAPTVSNATFLSNLKSSGNTVKSVNRDNQSDWYGLYFDYYDVRRVDGKDAPVLVMYYLEGNGTNCKNKDTVEFISGGTYPTIQLWKRSTTGYTDVRLSTTTNKYTTRCYVTVS